MEVLSYKKISSILKFLFTYTIFLYSQKNTQNSFIKAALGLTLISDFFLIFTKYHKTGILFFGISSDNYLKEHGVDLGHALELLGDIEMYNMTLHGYLEEIGNKHKELKNYLDMEDMDNYAVLVHSMKSDAKYLGFMDLAGICYQHELKSKEKDIDFCRENFTKLENELNKYVSIAREYVNSLDK